MAGGATVTLFTVPTTEEWIVKEVAVTNNTANPSTVTIYLANSLGTIFMHLAEQALAANTFVVLPRWCVAGPGDQCFFFSNIVGVYAWLSGAKLPGVS